MKRKTIAVMVGIMVFAGACGCAEASEFTETTLVDNEVAAVKVTSIDPTNFMGYTLNVYLENKTDKNLMYSLDLVSVDGWMCDPFWADEVTAGMKDNSEISFSNSSLEECGITDVTDITFQLNVYDSDDFSADYFIDGENYSIYPMGQEQVVYPVREPQSTDLVLVDDGNCTVTVVGFDPDDIMGYTMKLYVENKTDKTLMYSIDDAAVNGFMSDPYFATEVAAGKKKLCDVSWSSSDFANNGITDVSEISMKLKVYDSDDWMADPFVEQTFLVNP